MLFRLRSPIFDHGALGIPIRKTSRRTGNLKEEQELAEFRELVAALVEIKDSTNKEEWRAAAKLYLGWLPVEADLHMEVFDTMFQVEQVQRIPDVMEEPVLARRLRFALFVVIQLYELHRPRRTSSMDLFNIHSVPENKSSNLSPIAKEYFAGTPALSLSPSAGGAGNSSDSEVQDEFDPRQLILESRKKEWSHRITFITRRIGDIVDMLHQLTSITSPTPAPSPQVSKQALDALGFLLAGSDQSGERASRLSDAFFDLKGDLTVAKITLFLQERLVADETRNPQWSSFDLNKEWQSASSLSSPAKGAPTMIRGACQHELVVVPPPSSRAFTVNDIGSATVVAASHGAHIICLAPATYAHIIGCSDCTIFLGPVVGVCTIEHCERVRVNVACGRVRLVNCIDIKLNAWTGNRPVLLGDCRGVVAGPLAVRYPNVFKHCCAICPPERVISPTFQAWRHPVLTDAGGVDEDELEHSVFSILPPEEVIIEPVFAALPSDFPLSNFTQDDLRSAPLPAEYAARLNERKQHAQATMGLVRDAVAGLKASKGSSAAATAKSDLNVAIQGAFRDWLDASGNLDQILSRFITAAPGLTSVSALSSASTGAADNSSSDGS